MTVDTPPARKSGSIFHKAFQLYAYLHKCTGIFPKKDRYTLGVKIEGMALEFFELIILAKDKPKASKILILKKADMKITLLKLFCRLAFDLKAMKEKEYIEAEDKLLEIGKILGGWIKYVDAKGPCDEALYDTSGEPNA